MCVKIVTTPRQKAQINIVGKKTYNSSNYLLAQILCSSDLYAEALQCQTSETLELEKAEILLSAPGSHLF